MKRLRWRTWWSAMLLAFFVAGCLVPVVAQQPSVPGSSNVIVPPFVKFGGVLKDLNGNPLTGVVGVTFSLYTDSKGGVPVWSEVQNVRPDDTGRYSVMLGFERGSGLPADIFVSGEVRWLGVQPEGQAEQARVFLLSVPYALKAADAETLGGKPASAYLLNPSQVETSPPQGNPVGITNAPASNNVKSVIASTISGGGTTDFIPRWTSNTALGNSIIFQSTVGKLGIGTTSPLATLDIRETTGARAIASGNGIAIFGNATVASGTGKGVEGDSSSTSGTGVAGVANATTGFTQGMWGGSYSTGGVGVIGEAYATSGKTIGVEGLSASSTGTAGVFNNTGGGEVLSGQTNGTEVFSVNANGITEVGVPSPYGGRLGMLTVTSNAATYPGLSANGLSQNGPQSGPSTPGIIANGGTATQELAIGGDGIDAYGGGGNGPDGVGGNGLVATGGGGPEASGIGVVGYGGGNEYYGATGVEGFGGAGVLATPGIGVYALGGGGGGFVGAPVDGDGVVATTVDGGTFAGSSAYAGHFIGDINVTGTIFAGTKDFRIDHPLDPANKYLFHASVESSEMMDIYTGNITLDGKGEATVQFPTWFEALNADFRYQLTSVGAPGPGLYIAQEISGHRFTIAGGKSYSKVSWQVTAVRRDAYARAHPLVVEQTKNGRERGSYIHPELFGAPEGQRVDWVQHPDLQRTIQEARARQKQLRPHEKAVSRLPKPEAARNSPN